MVGTNARRRWLAWSLSGVGVLLVGALVWYMVWDAFGSAAPTDDAKPTTSRSTPTADPAPTATGSAEPVPPSATAGPTPTPSSTGTLVSVTPFITADQWDAGAATLTVNSVVPGVIDASGTCTAVLSKGAASVSASHEAVSSASSMDCGSLVLQSPSITSGSWTLIVEYASPTAAGSSAPYEVDIP